MRIERIALREIQMRLKSPFVTSFGVTQNRRILLVKIIADGVSGWGEVTAMENPWVQLRDYRHCLACVVRFHYSFAGREEHCQSF
jgi:L-alanine-DL-glutamate epimerase-like enolase superfamily enzyme